MSPKKKEKNFPAVRVSGDLLQQTEECAKAADEYLSDYIRKAVEQRNAQHKKPVNAEISEPITVVMNKSELIKLTENLNGGKLGKTKQEVQTFFKGK